MLSLLLGFASSFAPNILDYFKQKQDDKQELAMMKETRETQVALGNQKMQMVQVTANANEIEAAHEEQSATIARGSRWLANLSGSIRPVVTYAFVIEFLIITWSIAYLTIAQDGFTIATLNNVLDDDFMELLKAMLAFWFGNRTFGKRKA